MRILETNLHSATDGNGFRKAIEFSYGCSNESFKPFEFISLLHTDYINLHYLV